MFKSWNSCAVWKWFLLKLPQDKPPLVYMTLCDIAMSPRNKHFVTTFVNVSPIFTEWCHCLWHANTTVFTMLKRISGISYKIISMELYKYARTAIRHVCFIVHVLTFAGSLGICLNTRRKNMYDPYIINLLFLKWFSDHCELSHVMRFWHFLSP